VAQLAPAEIRALAKLIDELDYYQLLEIPRGASGSQLKKAYYETLRRFHPDANRHLEDELRSAVEAIAKRLCEAYSVIRDPRRRRAYDAHLADDGGLRMQLAAADAAREAHQQVATTPKGRRFYQLAQQDLRSGQHAAAERNLRMALTFEPENDRLKAELAKLS